MRAPTLSPTHPYLAPPRGHPITGVVATANVPEQRYALFYFVDDEVQYYEEFSNTEPCWEQQLPTFAGAMRGATRVGVHQCFLDDGGYYVNYNYNPAGTVTKSYRSAEPGSGWVSLAQHMWQTWGVLPPKIADPLPQPIPIDPFPTRPGTYTTVARDGRIGTYTVEGRTIRYAETLPFGRALPVLAGEVDATGAKVGYWKGLNTAFNYALTPEEICQREEARDAGAWELLLWAGQTVFDSLLKDQQRRQGR